MNSLHPPSLWQGASLPHLLVVGKLLNNSVIKIHLSSHWNADCLTWHFYPVYVPSSLFFLLVLSVFGCPCWSSVTPSKTSLLHMYNHNQTHVKHERRSGGGVSSAAEWNVKYCSGGGIIYVPPISFFIGLIVTTVWIFCLAAYWGQGHVCIRRWIMTLITMLTRQKKACEEGRRSRAKLGRAHVCEKPRQRRRQWETHSIKTNNSGIFEW